MISMKKFLFPALGLLALAVVACGGGGASSPSAPGSIIPAQSKSKVTFVLKVPVAAAKAPSAMRKRMNEAQSTKGLTITVYPNPQGTSTPAAIQAFDVSATAAACVVNTDTSRTCSVGLNLAPGAYVVNLASYDASPTNSTTPAGTQIGIGSCTMTITAGQTNTIPVVINGIASTVNVTLPIPMVNPLRSLTQNAIVSVFDVDNDLIVSPSYVDSSGNPVTVALTVSGAAGFITLGSTSFSVPQPNGVSVSYSPTNITGSMMTQTNSWSIAATLSNNSATSSATVASSPALSSVSIAAPAYGIANQGNNQLWVTEPSTNNIQSLQPQTHGLGAPIGLASSSPIGPTPGPRDIMYMPSGGMLWMTFNNTAALGLISTSGTGEAGVSLSGLANSLANDGTNVWTTEPTAAVIAWTPATAFSVTTFAFTAGQSLSGGLATGPGGKVYATYTNLSAGYIGAAATPSPGPLGSFALPTAASGPTGIAYDGASTLYVIEQSANKVAVVTGTYPGQTANEYGVGVTPNQIVYGPDGNAWFDTNTPSPAICKITPAGVSTCFPMPAGTNPGQMAVFYNQIWIVDTSNPTLYALNL